MEERGVRYVQGDVQDREVVLSLVGQTGSEPIVHLSGIVTAGCDRDPGAALAVNVLGMRNVLDAACAAGRRRVVFSSTIAVYGRGLPQPIDETMPTEPDGWYGLTKVMAERMGTLYLRRHGLDSR
jgi:nucleoside-diphosphate-sugar epimerase